MSQSSRSVLNGVHKIYQRVLAQAPTDDLTMIETRRLSAYFTVADRTLFANLDINGQLYFIEIAQLHDDESFLWVPHTSVNDPNEIIAITEMLDQFHRCFRNLGGSYNERTKLLRLTCADFFRETYR